jgi:hypothetical protein
MMTMMMSKWSAVAAQMLDGRIAKRLYEGHGWEKAPYMEWRAGDRRIAAGWTGTERHFGYGQQRAASSHRGASQARAA